MELSITRIVQQPIETNCYVISDGKGSIVIDPGSEKELPYIREAIKGKLYAVILTHLHYDHCAAAHHFDAPKYVFEKEKEAIEFQKKYTKEHWGFEYVLPEHFEHLEEEMQFGDIKFKVMHTPGHTIGGVCLLFDEFIISGDTLFAQTHGRTDLGGDNAEMLASLKKLSLLSPELLVLPGHGEPTSIAAERDWIAQLKKID